MHCGENCDKGEMKFSFRTKQNKQLSDQRSLHPMCLPVLVGFDDTRARDRPQVRRWLRVPEISEEAIVELQCVRDKFFELHGPGP